MLRNLVADILKTINEYTYYISDIFLRYIPGRDVLWFRNESPEEGDRLRDVLQPKSYAIRCKIAQLYQKLYPIPEDEESEDAEPIEAEIADDNAPSGTTEEDKKITVMNEGMDYVEECLDATECRNIFKMIFESMNQKQHYDMMMGIHQGG